MTHAAPPVSAVPVSGPSVSGPSGAASSGIDAAAATARLADVIAAVEDQLLGRRAAVEMALACILADGHLLIEDAPGSGKTSLSAALAAALGLEFQRVQCTNDLLPADITGLSIFDRDSGSFSLREGPVFTQMLLADELNRAPSKTQSALLQAMEERAVTIDRETRPLPRPFLVIATQNPAEQIGTFDLPESQLDRFSLSMEIGRPDHDIQAEILAGQQARDARPVTPVMTADDLLAIQVTVRGLAATPEVITYALRLADAMEARTAVNLSVRFRSQLLQLARANAVIRSRDFVAPDDIQAMFLPALRHRLTRVEAGARADLVGAALADTPLP